MPKPPIGGQNDVLPPGSSGHSTGMPDDTHCHEMNVSQDKELEQTHAPSERRCRQGLRNHVLVSGGNVLVLEPIYFPPVRLGRTAQLNRFIAVSFYYVTLVEDMAMANPTRCDRINIVHSKDLGCGTTTLWTHAFRNEMQHRHPFARQHVVRLPGDVFEGHPAMRRQHVTLLFAAHSAPWCDG